MLHQILIAQRLPQPMPQKFPVLVERANNPSVIVQGYGHTPDDAAESIRRHVREYGYYDAVSVSPAPEEPAPERGIGR